MFVATVLLAFAVTHAPIQTEQLQIQSSSAPPPPPLHCTHQLVTGKRIHLGSAPRACAFDPVYDEMYCGTEGGELIRVSPEQARVVERWRVTQGKVFPRPLHIPPSSHAVGIAAAIETPFITTAVLLGRSQR